MQKNPYSVQQKIIISGTYIEHYTYEKEYWVGFPQLKKKFRPFIQEKVKKDQESIREDNVRRTRIKIRRLVNCNQDLVKFMTLTFGTEVMSLDLANSKFKTFIQRLKVRYPNFKYLCVPEFMKNGRVHYHLLCNIPYIDNLQLTNIWGNGFTFIRRIDNIDNLGAYICKYLGKANFDPRYFQHNKFFYSYNLLRPIIIDTYKQVIHILTILYTKIYKQITHYYNFEFYSKYLGNIIYKQFRLKTLIKFTF